MMKKIIKIALFSFFVFPILNAETIQEHEARINKMEEALKAEVDKLNKRLHAEKASSSKNEQKEYVIHSAASKPSDVDSDSQNEQLKQVLAAVEQLTKKVEDLDAKVNKGSKGKEKKKTIAEPPVVELTPEAEKIREAEGLLEKDPTKAIKLMTAFTEACAGETVAIDAYLVIGKAYMKLAKWDLAEKTADNVLTEEKATVYQQAEGYLLKADAQRQKNDRVSACKTLITLERSNIAMTQEQNEKFQDLIVISDCSSKMDKDKKEEEGEQ